MWELIEQNKKKSIYIFVAMFFILVSVGTSVGYTYATTYTDQTSMGLIWGAIGSILLWAILSAISYYLGDRIILNVSQAVEVTPEFYPRLSNIVDEMKIAANLPYRPEIYIINDESLNAFATGIRPEKSAIVVTAGLVENLTRDELQGVIAHEMSHIINRDVLFMTFAGVLLGSISMLTKLLIHGTVTQGRRASIGSGLKSPVAWPVLIINLILIVFAPMFSRIFFYSLSKKREYLADASAVRLTRYPEGLASALEKISAEAISVFSANKITAPMFISNPFAGNFQPDSNYSTHPPVFKRIQILRSIGNNVGYRQYQAAYSNLMKKDYALIPDNVLKNDKSRNVREASKEKEKPVKKRSRDINDFLRAANGFIFLPCTCGLNIKVPPKFGESDIQCPRCSKVLIVPSLIAQNTYVENAAISKPTDTGQEKEISTPLQYKKMSTGWETFNCKCGHAIHLSPMFKSKFILCKKCKSKVEIL